MVQKKASSWIWSYVGKYKFGMAAGLFLSVVVAALNMVNPIITGNIVDKVIQGGQHELLFTLIGIMLLTTLAKSAFRYSYQVIFEHCSQNIILQMREDLYAHIQKLDFSWYDTAPSGNVMTLLTADLDKVRHFVAWVLYQCVENGLIYLFSIITLSTINWKLTLAFLIIAPPVLVLIQKFKKHIKPAHLAVRDQFAVLNTRVAENIEGNRVVKAFVRENYEIDQFTVENQKYCDVAVENADVRVRYTPWIDALCGILPVILIVFGGYLVVKGEMTIGELVTFNGLMWCFTQPINMFGILVDNIQNYAASADRLYELHCTETKIDNKKEAARNAEKAAEAGGAGKAAADDKAESAEKAPASGGTVEFRNVSFGYNEVPVLKDVSFKIESGQTVGILGPTGSGKSTIANLMCRYYDVTDGQILVNGKDVRDWNLQDLRRTVGITMQEAFLFSDTVEGNIAFADQDATMEEIEESAELARVKEFIGDLTDGYDTIVGERGVGLSGGQKQRIALARLFRADPAIMILDDTTSAVDNETEYKIRQSIKKQSAGHTCFIISHRVSSFESCDTILVIQNSRIVEQGSHDELMNREGYYRDVYNEQRGM